MNARRNLSAFFSGKAACTLASSLLLSLPLLCFDAPSFATQDPGAAQKAVEAPTPEQIRAQFAAKLMIHESGKKDFRIAPISAFDRRRAIPNDPRPPKEKAPKASLPPRPESKDGVIRRVEVENGEKVCALTFDLCELATNTNGFDADLVGWLQDNSVPATFFMGGKWMRTHAKRVRSVMQDPLFEIGNHAWTHGNFGIMSEEKMKEEILFMLAQYEEIREQALKESGRSGNAAEIPPLPALFRFPYGRTSEKALSLLADYGLAPIQWDIVAESDNNATMNRARAVVAQVKPGSILLFHANLVPVGTFYLVRNVVKDLKSKGYRFVCVSELLSMGKPSTVKDGYFNRPGDNLSLDGRYGVDGTGVR